jgi:hypothetical protein
MTTAEFLAHLERHRGDRLAFSAGARRVPPGYHVTEVKATTIHAADCGGSSTAWNETTVQLWSPSVTGEGDLMAVDKFLGIYGRVSTMVPIDSDARVRVEYGPIGEPAVSYVVSDVIAASDGVLDVRLAAPAVACKGIDRSVGDVPLVDASAPTDGLARSRQPEIAAGCCGPVAAGGARTCCG